MDSAVIKKSYEISYALFRLSATLKHAVVSHYLEDSAIRLVAGVARENTAAVEEEVRVAEYVLRLGADAGVINPANTEVLIREMETLKSRVAEFANASESLPDLNLENIFTENPTAFDPAMFSSGDENVSGKEEEEPENNEPARDSSFSQSDRQDIILGRIRQKGVCRVKDIQDALPNLSERTLRYDLQKLVEQGAVERIGNGGPATSYRLAVSVGA